MRSTRRAGALDALVAGLLLLSVGIAGALMLTIPPAPPVQTAPPPTARSLAASARQDARRLFPGRKVLAVYVAEPPQTGAASPPGQVLVIEGKGGKALFYAMNIFPTSQGAGWSMGGVTSQGVAETALSALAPAQQTAARTWARQHGVSPSSLVAWPFPAGTLIVGGPEGRRSAAAFRPQAGVFATLINTPPPSGS